MTPSKRSILLPAGVSAVAVAAIVFYLTAVDTNPATDSHGPEGAMTHYRVGELVIGIKTEPETPRVGENRLLMELRDTEGNPVTDIGIDAYAEMASMGAMAPMRAPVDLEQTAPGRFEGSFKLAMRGAWPLTLQISDPRRGDRRVQFNLVTDREGLSIASGGTPVGAEVEASGDANVIDIDSRRRQLIGVETGKAAYRELIRAIRAVGEVTYDERLLSQVTLKFDGFIGDLKADYVGASVEKGDILFTVYSPELLATQREYLETLGRVGSGSALHLAVRRRLRLWDLSNAGIEALERRGEPQAYVPIRAPRSGTVLELNIADGGAARRGETLLTIADLSRVWVEAQVFEGDLELIEEGMTANVMLPYLPRRRFEATVEYVYPWLDGESRTGRVRLTLDNPDGALKPNMYAEVSLQADLGRPLTVPEEAVIVSGDSRVVFVDLGGGRLKPVHIRAGRRTEDFVEVLDGLSAGDTVVTSGNFLIAAETRLKTGIEQW